MKKPLNVVESCIITSETGRRFKVATTPNKVKQPRFILLGLRNTEIGPESTNLDNKVNNQRFIVLGRREPILPLPCPCTDAVKTTYKLVKAYNAMISDLEELPF